MFPLYADEKEDDDDMHMPMPDDDIKLKPKWKDHFTRDSICSTIGLILMILGLLCIFVALPVLSFQGIIHYGSGDTPLDEMWKPPQPEKWAIVNNNTYPLMQNLRFTLIDKDTPESVKTRTDINGDELELVFSDEFNDNNRTFYPGDDPYWFAPDIWYGATIDLDWYDPDAVSTWDGVLELRLDQFPNHGVLYRSGMLNSWNQLCFKGGVFEVSVSLPGPAGVQGYWPGAWTMGNLGRPGYLSTTEGMWPYTYNDCDAGITPNQSMTDGTSRLPGQRLPSCTCKGEDHPTPGTGRGAPEIDIFEAGANGRGLGIVTQSYQVAPFDIWWYPDYNFTEFPDYSISFPNTYTGGPFQQAISATTNLNNNWYDGKQYQKYAFEYVPGVGGDAYIAWFVGDDMTFRMTGDAVGPNGNVKSRLISEEPMSIILNMGFSTAWTFIDYAKLKFPTVYRIDYVRWYQKKGNHSVTCDPPGYETTQYIKDHIVAYTNPNLTVSVYTLWQLCNCTDRLF
jgi:beta-glucan synthesis-associated protein KRE6